MTTDTFPKAATRTAQIGGDRGAHHRHRQGQRHDRARHGDHAVLRLHRRRSCRPPRCRPLLRRGVDGSFNCTTVDSDTSTSDTVLLFATGQAEHRRCRPTAAAMLRRFRAARWTRCCSTSRCRWCATARARRSWSASTSPARSSAQSAKRVALAIANSPLVKTAIAGEDANWGRIVMAVGKAGEPADRDRLRVAVGGVWMARDGGVVPGYDEAPVVAHMKGREIEIAVDLGLGARARRRSGPAT